MNYGRKEPLREQTIAKLRDMRRQAEISLQYTGSRQGTREANKFIDQIDKELELRKLNKRTAREMESSR